MKVSIGDASIALREFANKKSNTNNTQADLWLSFVKLSFEKKISLLLTKYSKTVETWILV